MRASWFIVALALIPLVIPLRVLAEESEAKPEAAKQEAKTAPAAGAKKAAKPTDINELIERLDYPELEVVPRASQRLKIEAAEEERNWYLIHWPLEVSALATLYIGSTASSNFRSDLSSSVTKDANNAATITQGVGVGWLAAGLLLGFQRPYRAGMRVLSKFNEPGDRNTLLRERLAEETLERPAKVMRAVTVASVITNATMNAIMASYLTDQARIYAGVSTVLAFLPAIFDDHQIEVYEKHIEYKKKIYGPLSSTSFGIDPKKKTLYPTANLTWNF